MRKYILYIILIALMMASFLVSGLFFMNSEMVSIHTGIDNEKSIEILAEIDELPIMGFDAYNIKFYVHGKLKEIENEEVTIVYFSGEEETFIYEKNLSNFEEGEVIWAHYNYLPEGGKKIIIIEKAN